MFHSIQKVLILAPHPDDAEFGLGGTLVKLLEMGKEVHVVVFSMCEKSTPVGFEVGIIEKEMYESLEYLGVPKQNIHALNFEVREFPALRQEILEAMVSLNKQVNPDLVFLPSSSDIHQDHETIHKEGIRAFKYSSILGYEMPWNNFGFHSFVYVPLTEYLLKKKIEALKLYKSQLHRPYSNISFLDSLARLRGTQIKKEFAESFELIRWIEQ